MPKTANRKAEKEQEKIDQFRERLKDIIKPDLEDFNLRKWLKARNFDLNKAEQMFRDSVAYKDKMKVETLLAEYDTPEVIKKYLTGGFCGHDKEGSPIRVELYGHLDLKGIMASVKKSDLEKTKLLQCEWTVKDWERESKKRGYRVDGLSVIFDMEGVGTRMLWRPGLQMYLHLVKVLEDNYPEMMKRLYVINAPRIFPLLYKLARPLISDDMRNKIHVFGDDYKHHLLKCIDPDQLPQYLGGTLTDPDGNPRCKTMINQGGEVPQKYYMESEELLAHMTKTTIPRGDKILVKFDVQQEGCILSSLKHFYRFLSCADSNYLPRPSCSKLCKNFDHLIPTEPFADKIWEFKTEDYDIGFGVLHIADGKSTPVIPVARVNSHVLAEDGSLNCDKLGTYGLYFDNSFSWTRSKIVYYIGEVLRVEDDYVKSELKDLIEEGDWETLEAKFETTHL